MSTTVTIAEAKAKLSALADRAFQKPATSPLTALPTDRRWERRNR